LSTAFVHDPESFQVRVADSLVANERTGKTANFLVREEERTRRSARPDHWGGPST
jgi:hypothetical protein